MRIVAVTITHDDGTAIAATFEPPEKWEVPADWHQVSSVWVPDATAGSAALESAGALQIETPPHDEAE